MKEKWAELFQLFIVFLKIAPVTFGGGYAMIPLIEREIVEKKRWLTTEEMTDAIAVVESAPGAIGINLAIFIGYRLNRVSGALVSLLGMVFPTFIIMITLSILYMRFKDNQLIEAAFIGIRAAVVALIIYAGIRIGKTAVVDRTAYIIIAIALIIELLLHVHPFFMIISGAVAGIIIMSLRKKSASA